MGKRFYCGVDGPVVETKKGKLRGYLYDKVYHFLGTDSESKKIPYAGGSGCMGRNKRCRKLWIHLPGLK